MQPEDQLMRAIDALAAAQADDHSTALDEAHRRDVEQWLARPENQDGADKSWVWPAYEFCRRHFERARAN